MELNTFPFGELPEQTMIIGRALADLIDEHDVIIQTLGSSITLSVATGKEPSSNIDFVDNKVRITMKLNPLANHNPAIKEWLGRYHSANFAKLNLKPNIYACNIMSEFDGGRVRFFFTYMMVHEDGSLAHESPQGKLMYETSYKKLPKPAEKKSKPQDVEQASWL